MRKVLNIIFVFFGVVFLGLFIMTVGGLLAVVSPKEVKLNKDSILHLELEGIITGDDELLEHLVKYRKDEHIKGVLIHINSPGGVVGPSQELYSEIKRVREEFQKPVVVSGSALMASGAYYAAVAADKIIVNPGTLMGSIGVIMQFANMEKLYEWAKMDIYSIKTGAYKDSGAPYREMRPDEKVLFQELINEVHGQFKKAVADGRKLRPDDVEKYSDGRIFHGQFAVDNGFADQVGTFEDARRAIGEMAGLGADPQLFKPQDRPEDLMEWLEQNASFNGQINNIFGKLIRTELVAQPLFLLPGVVGQ